MQLQQSRLNGPVSMLQVTANLVKLKLRVGEQHLRPLPVDQTVLIGSVEVTLLDANQ